MVKLNDHKRLEWLVNMNTMIYETANLESCIIHELQEKFNCGVQRALSSYAQTHTIRIQHKTRWKKRYTHNRNAWEHSFHKPIIQVTVECMCVCDTDTIKRVIEPIDWMEQRRKIKLNIFFQWFWLLVSAFRFAFCPSRSSLYFHSLFVVGNEGELLRFLHSILFSLRVWAAHFKLSSISLFVAQSSSLFARVRCACMTDYFAYQMTCTTSVHKRHSIVLCLSVCKQMLEFRMESMHCYLERFETSWNRTTIDQAAAAAQNNLNPSINGYRTLLSHFNIARKWINLLLANKLQNVILFKLTDHVHILCTNN